MVDGTVRQLEHRNSGEFEFSQSEEIQGSGFYFEKIFYQRIKNIGICFIIYSIIVSIYTSYAFLKSNMYVSHDRYVTAFDLVEDTIIKHQKFDANIY